MPYTLVDDNPAKWTPPNDASIVITHMHYRWEDLSALRRLLTQFPHIPLLVLADGILEYRNTWLNAGIPEGSMFQPLFGHKIACIGKSQARVLESWGNVGKCEVIGLPRLDAIAASANNNVPKAIKQPASEKFRLLIATAQTPAFNDSQYDTVVQSLQDLRQWLVDHPALHGRTIETSWRLTAGLDEAIGLPTGNVTTDGPLRPLLEVLDDSDAVITTPSTTYLESVLKGKPTAILDYHNTPAYLPPAWTIAAKSHIATVIRELANPPLPKLLFQDTTLADGLEHRSPATDRMIDLVLTMIACGNVAAETDQPIEYPYRIIADPDQGIFPVMESFDIQQLFPNAECFANDDLRQLQVELDAAIHRMGALPEVAHRQSLDLEKFRVLLDQSRQRREKMFETIKQLQARCQTLKAKLDAK